MKTKILILGLLLGLLAAQATRAATFTVTTTNDTGAGSLRQAITDANANGADVVDTIQFAITDPLAGVRTIPPATALPPITRPVIIDGYTQAGSSSNTLANGDNAVLLIEISGAIAAGPPPGLLLSGVGGSTLRGLVINNGWGRAVLIQTTNVVVEGCFIGTDPTGLVARPVGLGVFADSGLDTSSSRIGGTLPGQRNVILGGNSGIFFQSGTNHLVQGNFIGTDATGTNSLAGGSGISLQFSSGNLIGGTNTAARNVIVAASGYGINLSSSTG